MAGKLPGVQNARRRRCHGSDRGWLDSASYSSGYGSTRRSSFCLYTNNHESYLGSNPSSLQRGIIGRQACKDEKLGVVAREAKERLDERLTRWKSDTKSSSEDRSNVFGLKKKKSGSNKFNWASKLGWKASEQDKCAVCLEQFKRRETLVYLPCAHRFHSRCLVPWLESNAHCPCCRMGILN